MVLTILRLSQIYHAALQVHADSKTCRALRRNDRMPTFLSYVRFINEGHWVWKRWNTNLGDIPTRRPVYPFAGSYGHLSLPSSKPEEKLNRSASLQRQKRKRSFNHFISSHDHAEMKSQYLLYKHKEAWRRLFHRRTGESHCIAAGIGCDCNTLSAEKVRKTGYFWLHNEQGWRGTYANQWTSCTGAILCKYLMNECFFLKFLKVSQTD